MKAIILLGAPGSGKGTVAERVRDRCAYLHVSTGDMLRDAVKRGTETGRQAEGYMKRGELVPDAVINLLVDQRLDAGTPDAGYMFDGYPRTIQQADMLAASFSKRNGSIRKVFLLETPRDVLISRLTGRRTCRACGTCFHVVNIPPKRDGICDACGGALYQRPDDQEATIVNRLDVYMRQTESLIAFYEKQGLLMRINSNRQAEASAGEVVRAVQALD